jgi:RimJ/RimL family protein N-acetyltransferase
MGASGRLELGQPRVRRDEPFLMNTEVDQHRDVRLDADDRPEAEPIMGDPVVQLEMFDRSGDRSHIERATWQWTPDHGVDLFIAFSIRPGAASCRRMARYWPQIVETAAGSTSYDAVMLRPAYPIETPRLLLRPVVVGDFDDLLAYYSRPDVARYLYNEPHTAADFSEVLERKAARTAIEREGDGLVLAVVPRDVGRVVGDISLAFVSEAHKVAELGFVISPEFQGRGYAREASEVVMRLGFEGLDLHRMVGRLDARNTASANLLERLGMHREAHFVENEWVKGEWTDEFDYAILRTEWERTAAGSRRPSA